MKPSTLLNKSILYAKLHNHYFKTCDSCILGPNTDNSCPSEFKIMLTFNNQNKTYTLKKYSELGQWDFHISAWCVRGLQNKKEMLEIPKKKEYGLATPLTRKRVKDKDTEKWQTSQEKEKTEEKK